VTYFEDAMHDLAPQPPPELAAELARYATEVRSSG
jgi:hypothetical protein